MGRGSAWIFSKQLDRGDVCFGGFTYSKKCADGENPIGRIPLNAAGEASVTVPDNQNVLSEGGLR